MIDVNSEERLRMLQRIWNTDSSARGVRERFPGKLTSVGEIFASFSADMAAFH